MMSDDQAFEILLYAVMAAAVIIIAAEVYIKRWGGHEPHA